LKKTIKTAGYFVLTEDLNCKSVAHIKDFDSEPSIFFAREAGKGRDKTDIRSSKSVVNFIRSIGRCKFSTSKE
jgi:hypothetical protein